MSFTFNTTIKSFLLPGDGDEALAEFLTALNSPFPTYIIAYNFSLAAMIDEILKAHANGVPIHIYLDHTQSTGPSERDGVQKLIASGLDVTIGTSPKGSAFICHTKGLIVLDNPLAPYCLEGSTNFSKSGFNQVNTMNSFRSLEWANNFRQQFALLKSFAWVNEKDYQLYPAPVTVLDTVTASDGQVQVEVEQTQTKVIVTPEPQ
jgi:hypothetical protein